MIMIEMCPKILYIVSTCDTVFNTTNTNLSFRTLLSSISIQVFLFFEIKSLFYTRHLSREAFKYFKVMFKIINDQRLNVPGQHIYLTSESSLTTYDELMKDLIIWWLFIRAQEEVLLQCQCKCRTQTLDIHGEAGAKP